MKIGPDGAIYFIDWHNPIIGHMQHNLRDPNRNRTHGRIYRVTYEGRPLSSRRRSRASRSRTCSNCSSSPKIGCATGLRSSWGPQQRGSRRGRKWIAALDKKDADYRASSARRLVGASVSQRRQRDLFKKVLASPDFRARAAATRVLCYWREQIPDALNCSRGWRPKHPRVRLEAVRAASFFNVPEAIEVPLIAEEQPTTTPSTTPRREPCGR